LSALLKAYPEQRDQGRHLYDPKAVAEKKQAGQSSFLGERPNPYLYESELSLRLFMVCGE